MSDTKYSDVEAKKVIRCVADVLMDGARYARENPRMPAIGIGLAELLADKLNGIYPSGGMRVSDTKRNAGCSKCKWFVRELVMYGMVTRCLHKENLTTKYDWEDGEYVVYGKPSELNADGLCPHWEAKDESESD